MKIMFLVRSLHVGGAERQLVAVANGLATKGYDVAVAQYYSGGSLEHDLVNVQLIDLKKTGRWDILGFCQRLISSVRLFGPDVMYSFLGTSNIIAATLKPFWKNTRVVWSVRASDMDYSHYDRLARFSNWLEARLARFADGIIANSRAGIAHAIGRGMNREIMTVVPNGIDTDCFRLNKEGVSSLRQQWKVAENEVLVGLVARIDPMKDHETFLRAVRIVADADSHVRFVCVGGGEHAFVEKVRTLSEELGLGDFLTWAGELDYMNPAYNALDICCLSSMTEGFPNVVGEAMSCGVPCVVTDVGDAAFIVGETGLVAPRRDPEALSVAILQMVALVRTGDFANPRKRIVDEFSLEQMVLKSEQALQA
ncbi:MAG: glycosyltransferase [Pseudodesulfovibrio sp.]|nr:glycosyltransferase [Pseudodesulfovibrio sp.]